MSPAQILERSYQSLKGWVVAGRFHAGQRLEAARLAEEMQVSITPIRDVLNRLAGEGLVHAIPGGGFYIPVPNEGDLRDLLEWNMIIAIHAARGKRTAMSLHGSAPGNIADRTARLFNFLAEQTANKELALAVATINDKLHAMRQLDDRVVGETGPEFDGLEKALAGHEPARLAQQIRRFHHRRRDRLPAYVRLLRTAP